MYNKTDLLPKDSALPSGPGSVAVSAMTGDNFDTLMLAIEERLFIESAAGTN